MNRYIATTLLAGLMFCVSCRDQEDSSTGKKGGSKETEWIIKDEFEPDPIQHDSLSQDQLDQIQAIQETFADMDRTPLETWMDNFKREPDLEQELATWQCFADAYSFFIKGKNLPRDHRKEAYKVVVLHSIMPPENILNFAELKLLSKADAKEIIDYIAERTEPMTGTEKN